MSRWSRGLRGVLLLCVSLALASCGNGTGATTTEPEAVTTTGAPTTTTVEPEETTAPETTDAGDTNQLAEGSGCTPGEGALPDGEWYGEVADLTETTLSFDLACWFSGDGAVAASAEDGEESPPPNDYYVRNENPTLRELEIGAEILVTFYPDGDPTNVLELRFSEWDEMSDDRGFPLGVWVTIEDGEVTEIVEQWVP